MDEARKQLSRLSDLTGDVSISLPGDLHNLHYDAASGKWVNGCAIYAVQRAGGEGDETVVGGGAVVVGYLEAAAECTARLEASGVGAVAIGSVTAELSNSSVQALGAGALAVGVVADNDIFAAGAGSFAGGYVGAGDGISAQGGASVAFAHNASGSVFAGGDGAWAIGKCEGAGIHAAGDGCLQLGDGTNFIPGSLQVGDGICLCPSDPGATYGRSGNIWLDSSGRVCISSGSPRVNFRTRTSSPFWETF